MRVPRPGGIGVLAERAVLLAIVAGCSGPLSALDPAGAHAEELRTLFAVMVGGALAIWGTVLALTIFAARTDRPFSVESARRLVVVGGVVVPTLVLAALLVHGLSMLPRFLAAPPSGTRRIEVTGEQWWWRVRYQVGEEWIELANEIRLPVGEPVELTLGSPDVIHSFWIPALGGKMDMIPGRTTRLVLEPTRTGTYWGVCAEYCGTSHAFMRFPVVVSDGATFDAWLARQRAPATAVDALGRERFEANGCGACHAIRGTRADGVIGPDLTHVGSRLTLGAGTAENGREALARWITETGALKPDVHMPAFPMLPDAEVDAIATFLASLR
jgi:cytochrome c oxidase subunit II